MTAVHATAGGTAAEKAAAEKAAAEKAAAEKAAAKKVVYSLRPSWRPPVLRPLRQNLHDMEIWPAGELVYRRELFVNRRAFANGMAKNEFHCNMPADSMLGTPLEFDLIGFQARPHHGISSKNFNAFYGDNTGNGGAFQWIFGSCVRWLSTQCQQIPQGTGLSGIAPGKLLSILAAAREAGITPEKLIASLAAGQGFGIAPEKLAFIMDRKTVPEDMLEKLASLLAASKGTAINFYNTTDIYRRARKITSNETFRNIIEHSKGFVAEDEDVYYSTTMVGVLYAFI